MFENIKSAFILKKIFFILNETHKFKIIKYNKSLQNRLNINLMSYKRFSGRYIIYETKKKGKEYDYYKDRLIFEGEYINGERNGIGKEYEYIFERKFKVFEGEYLKGKRHGQGKEFSDKDIVKFEGEYLNGKRWNGKIYNKYNDTIIYMN